MTGGKGSAKARRTAARLAAVQALYQLELGGGDIEATLKEYIAHRLGEEFDGERFVAADPELFLGIVRGAWNRRLELDPLAAEALTGDRKLDRLEALLRATLRAGTFELFAHPETDAGIVINDYMSVANSFYGGKEPSLINAVLDRVAKRVRPAS